MLPDLKPTSPGKSNIQINGTDIEHVTEYLRHLIKIENVNQIGKLVRRIRMA